MATPDGSPPSSPSSEITCPVCGNSRPSAREVDILRGTMTLYCARCRQASYGVPLPPDLIPEHVPDADDLPSAE